MKTQLSDKLTVNLPIGSIASEIHAHGRYLRDSFSVEDLSEAGSDFVGTDVRLQVTEDGGWILHFGSADYDQDHRGFWACSSVRRGCSLIEARETARELINGIE
jgi:hypothetical protein